MIAFSFDTDHIDDARMTEFLAEAQWPGGGTFFCTQPYRRLEHDKFELAPHPFLRGACDWLAELKAKRAEFPNALGWRAHSCMFSHALALWLCLNGYVYASTQDSFGIKQLHPIRQMWGIWQVPIYYADNLDFSRKRFWPESSERPFAESLIETAVNDNGLYVFDFHPIHLLLNSPDADWYSGIRDRFLRGEPTSALRYAGYGARSFFDSLIAAMRDKNCTSLSIIEGLQAFTQEVHKPRDIKALRELFDERRLGL
jgi:hypothetical protein